LVFNATFSNISAISWQPVQAWSWLEKKISEINEKIAKTSCHDIAEILLKVALNTKNQSIHFLKRKKK
jgi:hypothetical protein